MQNHDIKQPLGPWVKTRCTRLFSYHNTIYKIRLAIAEVVNPEDLKLKGTPPPIYEV